MAPSSYRENRDPQQRYRALTRHGSRARPSAVAATAHKSGIERSYDSITQTLKAVPSSHSTAGRSDRSYRSGMSSSRSSVGTSGGASVQSVARHGRTSTGTAGRKETGIERSYDSMTQTLKSVVSFASGTSGASSGSHSSRVGSGGGNVRGVSRVGSSRVSSGASNAGSHGSSGSVASRPSLASSKSGRAFTNQGPPPPVDSASFSFDHTPPTVVHSASSVSHSLVSAAPSVSQYAIGQHLLSASASMSKDEFDALRHESKQLRAAHEKRFQSKMDKPGVAGQGVDGGKALTHSTSTAVVSNARPKSHRNGRESIGSTGTSGLYASKLGHQMPIKDVVKPVVKLTSEGLKKITHILHMNSEDDDVMSFYCSNEEGEVRKQKVSLDRGEVLPQSPIRSTNGHGHADKGTHKGTERARRELQHTEEALLKSVKKVATQARKSVNGTLDRAGHEMAPKDMQMKEELLRKSVKKAARSARMSVDRTIEAVGPRMEKVGKEVAEKMSKDVAPKIEKGIKLTAKSVARVGRESVEGVGLLAKDLANAKTPARSNVTRNQGDYHMQRRMLQVDGEDYVHDPGYEVVMTPPPHGVNMNAGKTPYAYGVSDPQTPACLLGAVAAARCNLPGSHPESLEYLPDGIPRVLVVPHDWEERAGFVATISCASSVGRLVGASEEGVVAAGRSVGGSVKYSDNETRASNPIDVDEETETLNGEETDKVERTALRIGLPSPRMAGMAQKAMPFDDAEAEEEDSEESEDEANDPRNASMWVAVPDNIEDDDSMDEEVEDAERLLRVEDINMSEILLDDGKDRAKNELEVDTKDEAKGLAELAHIGSPLATPAFSVGSSNTFFVGDLGRVQEEDALGEVIEDSTVVAETIADTESDEAVVDDAASKALEDDSKSWLSESKSASEENHSFGTATVAKAPVATKIEDLDVVAQQGQPQAIAASEEDTLVSLATATAAAVVKDRKNESTLEFKTPYSVKKGERPLSFSEFKDMNRGVLFDLEGEGQNVQRLCGAQELYATNPSSGSTELSHEPPVRMVTGVNDAPQELYANPSESTGLSVLSNWKQDEEEAVAHPSASSKHDGKRQLKGRVILVRIKKKISKVAKKTGKLLFLPLKSKKGPTVDDGSFVVSLPVSVSNNPHGINPYPNPTSPSSASVLSISSSIMTGNGSATKRIMGIVPPKAGDPTPHQMLYGAINYGGNCFSGEESTVGGDESTVGGDELPPPPGSMPLPPSRMSKGDEEDAVSYLAEAMRRADSNDADDEEEEDSVLLIVTPNDDGTEEISQVISAADGTPVQVREVIEAINSEDADDAATSEVKPNNLTCLFTDEKGNRIVEHGTPIQIMDAVEVDGGIVLTPQGKNQNVSHVFRPSTGSTANLLPGSVIDSDDEDEDDTLLYHDGNTVIQQSSTFGDNTIDTRSTYKEDAKNVGGKLVKKNASLTPDGPALTKQAAKNSSFLFSPNNMGRAAPDVRAKERASLKDGKVPPSITMLPAVEKKTSGKQSELEKNDGALVVRPSFSFEPSLATATEEEDVEQDPLAIRQSYSFDEALEEAVSPMGSDAVEKEVEDKKQPMASMTEERQFSFKTILNKFSTDADEPKRAPSPAATRAPEDEEEMVTPLVTNAASKKKYPATPFPETDANSPEQDTSPPETVKATSPMSSASVSSSRSPKASSGKKTSPKSKSIPKSALRTRKGFVKARVSEFTQRIERTSVGADVGEVTVTAANGRLKRNHSYRLKSSRRMTDGKGVLAPRKAVLQTTYIRSVPIGIAKTYSRDSTSRASIGNSWSQEEHVDNEEDVAGAGEKAAYAAKYTEAPKPVESFDDGSPNNNGRASSASDASSYVSETTDGGDPFTSLLGKMTSEDEDSGSEGEEEDGEVTASGNNEKENAAAATSPSAHLPFKASTLVKPTELNQHEQERAPLSPVPPRAQMWRQMAAKSNSVRYHSETSWREISGQE